MKGAFGDARYDRAAARAHTNLLLLCPICTSAVTIPWNDSDQDEDQDEELRNAAIGPFMILIILLILIRFHA